MTTWVLPALLGLGLAVACGIRAFLPLTLLSGAVHFHVLPIELNPSFAWVGSTTAFTALCIATVIELGADLIPYVDHLVSASGHITGPITAAIAAGSVFASSDPSVGALAGIAVGAPTALGFSAAQQGVRVTSTATTGGLANPVVSVVEDIGTVILSVIALVAPIVIPVLLAVLLFIAWTAWKKLRRLRAARVAVPA